MNFSAGCDTIYLLSVGCITPCYIYCFILLAQSKAIFFYLPPYKITLLSNLIVVY
nr:MAG TPA: hypothetical protein [Caudoviricetes sp.]